MFPFLITSLHWQVLQGPAMHSACMLLKHCALLRYTAVLNTYSLEVWISWFFTFYYSSDVLNSKTSGVPLLISPILGSTATCSLMRLGTRVTTCSRLSLCLRHQKWLVQFAPQSASDGICWTRTVLSWRYLQCLKFFVNVVYSLTYATQQLWRNFEGIANVCVCILSVARHRI